MGRSGRRGPGHALAGWFAVMVVGGGLWWGLGVARAQPTLPEGDVGSGERLYTMHCVQCHSPDGRGGRTPDGQVAPPIHDVSIAYARLVLRTHRMPPGEDPFDNRQRPRHYDPQQMADVLAYLTERFDLTGDVPDPGHGDPARGLELYARNCAHCHGATGAGGVAGRGAWTPRINQYDSQMVADAVRVGPFEMPRFSEDALADEDLGDIAAYLAEVEAEPGALLFGGELNPVYASAFGVILMLAVLAAVLVVSGKPLYLPDERRDPDEPERDQ